MSPKPCRTKPVLEDRPLISLEVAGQLEDLFKLLANDTRLRLLHAIARQGEIAVIDLAEMIGMKPQAVSNQLLRLQTARIVASRREGSNVRYRVIDSCVLILLERGLCFVEEDVRRQFGSPIHSTSEESTQ